MALALIVHVAEGQNLESLWVTPDAVDTYFYNDGDTEIRIRNTSGSTVTVTLTTQRACNQGFVVNEPVLIEAASEWSRKRWSRQKFNDRNQLVHMAFSFVSNIFVLATK